MAAELQRTGRIWIKENGLIGHSWSESESGSWQEIDDSIKLGHWGEFNKEDIYTGVAEA